MEMMPVYDRSMDSNLRMNQVPKTPYWIPGSGSGHPQMKMDGPLPHVPYEYWSHGANHGYPVPCHGCCNHGSFPYFDGFRPSCSRQIPHFTGCGNYPIFYPVQHAPPYYIPPPHYSVDHPRYEYDGIPKNHHCCGCLNHPSHQYRDKKVVLEKQEPEAEKESKSVLVQPESYPYPMIWIPHESSINNEHQKPNESKVRRSDDTLSGPKAPESELKGWNGWFPLNLDSLRSLMENHDKKEVENEVAENAKTSERPKILKSCSPLDIDNLRSSMQNQDGKRAQNENISKSLMQSQRMERNKNTGNEDENWFPFPVVWMPFGGKQQEEWRGREGATAKTPDGSINNLEFSLPKLPEHNDVIVKSEAEDQNIDQRCSSDVKERTIHQGSIPVRQINHEGEKAEGTGEKQTSDAENLSRDKVTESVKKYQSSSPRKTSKLPPVCLRVDPLPKKGNGNGKSRSPSPPSREEKQDRNKKELKNSLVAPEVKSEDGVKKVRVIPVAGEAKVEDGTGKTRNVSEAVPDVVRSVDKATELGEMASKESPATKETNQEEAMKSDRGDEDKHEQSVKRYSDEEAATTIQSAYRGYEVRKWKPLKKLKQMAKVREEMVSVRNQIQAMEASSKKDEKQILILGESIMSLLLKLDAVQGLHPSVREVRKSLARELMKMQEQLDFIKNSEATVKEASVEIASENPGKETAEDGTKVEETMTEKSFGSSDKMMNSEQIPNDVEPELTVLPDLMELSRGQQSETIERSAERKEEKPQVAEETGASVWNEVPASVLTTKCGNDAGNFVLNVPQTLMSKADEEEKVPNEIVEAVSAAEEGIIHGNEAREEYHDSKEVDESKLVINNDDQSEPLKKFPRDLTVEEQQLVSMANNPEGSGGQGNEIITDFVVESAGSADIAGTSVSGISSLPEVPEINAELLELPVPVLDEDKEDKEASVETQGKESPHESKAFPESHREVGIYGARTEPHTSGTSDIHQTPPICHEHGQGKPEAENEILGETGESGGQMFAELEAKVLDIAAEQNQLSGEDVERQIREREKEREELKSETSESQHAKQRIPSIKNCSLENDDEAKTLETPFGNEVDDYQPLERDKKLVEENQRLKEMMEKLMEAGKEQLDVISRLNGRVKDLEKRLTRKKNVRTRYRHNRNSKSRGKTYMMKQGDSADML